jgi:acyl carrier protein
MLIKAQLAVDEDEISPSARFINDLGADSLDIVEMLMELEEKFNIEIADEELEKISTVGDVIDYLHKIGVSP